MRGAKSFYQFVFLLSHFVKWLFSQMDSPLSGHFIYWYFHELVISSRGVQAGGGGTLLPHYKRYTNIKLIFFLSS
jgi:hypothetical protein